MESEVEAYVVGEVKSEISLHELAAIYAQTALQISLSRYEMDVSYGDSLTLATYGPEEGEWLFHMDGGSRADSLQLARLLSEPLAARDIAHRFEVYEEATEELIGYFAHRWQPNSAEPDPKS